VVPDTILGPIDKNIKSALGIHCSNDVLKNWNPTIQSKAVNYGNKTIRKDPYSPLNIISPQGSPAPANHYPEVVSALLSRAVPSPIYIQDATPYLALLVGAATSA